MKTTLIISSILPGKRFSAVAMMVLMMFLTSINYLLYSGNNNQETLNWINTDTEESESGYPGSPAGPDEKSPNAPVSFNEEYIHEHSSVIDPFNINPLFEHKIHEAEKLCVVHVDLFCEPPEA